MTLKSEFTVQYSPDRMTIEVVDCDGESRSVTNDAEAVVEHVVKILGDLPIMYRDSTGTWDELKHNKGVFTDYGMIGTTDLEEARKVMKERYAR